jgi:hypothetical protein
MRTTNWFAAALAAILAMPGIAAAQLLAGPVQAEEPVVEGDVFYVSPNQTVNIEADLVDDRVVNLRVVPAVVSPEKTIVAKWETQDDGGVFLHVSNPFDKMLKFEMGMLVDGREHMVKTSSCPIVPNGAIFEMWPHPIRRIAIGRGRVLGKNAGHVCN